MRLVAVPCPDDDCLLLLDHDDGTEQGRVAVGEHPVHLSVVDDRVFVATMGERAVSVVADGTVHRVETGVLGPSHFAATDDGDVLVPCTGGDALAIIDADRLELRARVGVGAEPHDIAVRDGLAFVGSRADGTVTVVDPAAATVEVTHDLGADARIQGVEAASEGVYAVDQRDARLFRVTESGVDGDVPVGANPYDAVVADDRVLVAGRDDGTVTALPRRAGFGADGNPPECRVYDVGGRPNDLVLAGGNAWVLDRERARITPLESASGAVGSPTGSRSVDVPSPTFAGGVSPADTDLSLVTHYDDAAVSAVDLAAERVVWTADTPAHPFEPAVV